MAARNPSSFPTWWDETALRQGKNIVETVPDQIITGMEEIFDGAELIVSSRFKTIRTGEVGEAWDGGGAMEIIRYHIECTDMCDEDNAAGAVKIYCAARVWCDATSADASVRFQTLNAADSETVGFANTSPAWVVTTGSLDATTDGGQEDIQIDLRVDTGYDYAYCNGIAVWMPHR